MKAQERHRKEEEVVGEQPESFEMKVKVGQPLMEEVEAQKLPSREKTLEEVVVEREELR